MFYMKNEQPVEDKVELRGGIGTLKLQHLVPVDELRGAGTQVGIFTIEPGYSIGLHSHTDNYEIYHVLEGELEISDGGEVRTLQPGDSEVCGDGNTHSMINKTDKPAKMLAIIMWNQNLKK